MKSTRLHHDRGSVMISAAVTSAILTILVAGFLSYLANEYRLNYRSHSWNQALHLAESGIEYGYGQFAYQGGQFASAPAGWTLQGSSYVKTMVVTNAANQEVGASEITITGVGASNPQLQAVGIANELNAPNSASRAVRVTMGKSWRFPVGLMSKNTINMNGNNIETDSYDSSDLTKSTSGQYDPNKKQPNGDVASNATITNTVSVGNANISGSVSTGPGGTVTMGPNGTIGPTFSNPATSISAATANGWVKDNFNTDIPDVTLPAGAGSWGAPASYSGGNINGGGTVNTGTFKVNSIGLSGNGSTLTIDGNVILYVTGAISISGKGGIVLAPGASLTVYVGGNVSVAGNGVVNGSGSDLNTQFYGLPSSTSWSVNGNGVWNGTIYAPQADMSLNGGGNSGDVSGAIVAKSITLNGHVTFHYDERLKSGGPASGYVVSSWQELRRSGASWAP